MWQPFILITCWIFWCVDKKKGALTFFTTSWAMLANSLLKMIACVYRPWIRDARVAFVMFSRNYLGVHTPQDVCVGLLTGIVFIFLSVKAFIILKICIKCR